MLLSQLEKHINYSFKNERLLEEALTHRSYLNENPREGISHNERLEFLGDAVLELAVTEDLFARFPQYEEGTLTSFRAALVNYQMLATIARELELEKFLRLSRGEAKDTGRARQYILANAIEALIGAMYLDSGYGACKKFIERFVLAKLSEIITKKTYRDAKSLFQEEAQERVGVTPTYQVLDEWGPDHARQFRVGVFLNKELAGQGEGPSKQEAQQVAAEDALSKKGW